MHKYGLFSPEIHGSPHLRLRQMLICFKYNRNKSCHFHSHLEKLGRGPMFKILIVEDNRFYRDALRESVKARFPEVTVDEAGNGKEAMEKVNSLCPDLIFMDLRLPDESGLELTKKIRAAFANTCIIVLTS